MLAVRLIIALLLAGGFSAVAQSNLKTADFNSFQLIPNRNIFNPNRYANHPGTYRPRTTATRRRNTFTLTGTLRYDVGETPGRYAFFDGSNSEYRKVAKPDDTIAIFKITAITPDSVTLLFDTNQTVMKIGMQMREDDQGHWTLGEGAAMFVRNSYADERGDSNRRRNLGGRNVAQPGEVISENTDTNAPDNAPPDMGDLAPPPEDGAAPPETTTTDTVTLPAGPASDALMRLMQQRQREEQQTGGGNQPRN